jgi:hypothetical protein
MNEIAEAIRALKWLKEDVRSDSLKHHIETTIHNLEALQETISLREELGFDL